MGEKHVYETVVEYPEEANALLEDVAVIKMIGDERAPIATLVLNEDATIRDLSRLVGKVNRTEFRGVLIGQLLMTGFASDVTMNGEPATYAHLIYSPLGFLDHSEIVLGDFDILGNQQGVTTIREWIEEEFDPYDDNINNDDDDDDDDDGDDSKTSPPPDLI